MASADPAPTVADNPGESRFELRLDGEIVGFAEYRPAGDSVIIAHTEIAEGHEGEGLGGVLVREALERIRASGKTVIPTCPFTAAYIGRHPEFVELVAPALRDQFGRPAGDY
ncbi:MAG TPA: GNAT family N-acetyltransferase [Thermoleophilaceae bacterium]|nr:GNAT family N-acetyltransferase [Thermoleophilaceae bacterium]